MCLSRRVSVVRPNVHEFLIPPFGPSGGGQLLNYAIVEFTEELEKWEGTNDQHSRAGNSALKIANQGCIWPLYPHSMVNPTQKLTIQEGLGKLNLQEGGER